MAAITDIFRVLLAASYGHLGRIAEAKAEWTEALRLNPDYSLEHRRQVLPYKDPSNFDRLVEGLRKAGFAEVRAVLGAGSGDDCA